MPTMLVSSFLIPLSGFMLTPFMAYFLSDHGNLGPGSVGFIIGSAAFVQMGGSIFVSYLCNAIGVKRILVVALAIRTLSFALFALGLTHSYLCIVALYVSSISVALYMPTSKIAVMSLAGQHNRAWFLSLANSMLNAGMALGPPIGSLFIVKYPIVVFVVGFVIFTLITLLNGLFLILKPDDVSRLNNGLTISRNSLISVIPIGIPVGLGYFAFSVFQSFAGLSIIPLHGSLFFGLLGAVYALVIVVVQPLMSSVIESSSYLLINCVSFLSFAMGLFLFFSPNGYLSTMAAALIGFGEVLLFLKSDIVAADVPGVSTATALGFQRVFGGVGALLGTWGSGYLFSRASHTGLYGFWPLIAGVFSSLCVIFVAYFIRRDG